jgi:enolase
VPSGASTGAHEAVEKRDHGGAFAEKFYGGNSVYGAVHIINTVIAPNIVGAVPDISEIDRAITALDQTTRHEVLGGNATLAVSLAGAYAAAHRANSSLARLLTPSSPLLLPMPMVNILSGGAHAAGAMDIQDVLVIPHGANTFAEAISWVVAIRKSAATLGREAGFVTNLVADEGGLGIPFTRTEDACAFLLKVIEKVGLDTTSQVGLALDVAATQFYRDGKYHSRATQKSYDSDQWSALMLQLVRDFPVLSIEDPFAEDDWSAWSAFMASLPRQVQVVGDDHFTTNLQRLQRGAKEASANSILIKVNQNGLVSDTAQVLKAAHANAFTTVVSARSGETADTWLVDLSVGWRAGQIKVGSTHGSERSAKWNYLLELEKFEETVFAQPFKK